MKKYYSLLILMLLAPALSAQIDTTFHTTYGGLSHDYGRCIVETPDSGLVIVGSTSSFGNGLSDVYLIKIDTAGFPIWSKYYGGPDIDWGNWLDMTADNGFIITGYTNGSGAGGYDILLIKTDSVGNEEWSRTYGGSDWDFGYEVHQTNDGGYIIVGETYSFGAGNNDVYLIKTDSVGDTLWTRTFGGAAEDYGRSVKSTFDGGYIIAGATASFGAGELDAWLIKTDSIGDTLWTRTYGGDSADFANSVYQNSDTTYIVAGGSHSCDSANSDLYLFKTDSIGDTLWTICFGGPNNEMWFDAIQKSDGGYAIIGYTETTIIGGGGDDIYYYLITSNGFYQLLTTFGGSGDERGYAIKQTSLGGYVMVGHTNSYGLGMNDVFVIRTDATGLTGNPPVVSYYDSLLIGLPNPYTSIESVNFYPNPLTNFATIDLSGISGASENIDIHIYDILGRKVRLFNKIKTNKFKFEKGNLANGVYVYKVIFSPYSFHKPITGKFSVVSSH